MFRDTEPVTRQPNRVGQAGHDVPDSPLHTRGMHPKQHLVVSRLGPADVSKPQDVGLAVNVLDNRLHRPHSGRDAPCFCGSHRVLPGLQLGGAAQPGPVDGPGSRVPVDTGEGRQGNPAVQINMVGRKDNRKAAEQIAVVRSSSQPCAVITVAY